MKKNSALFRMEKELLCKYASSGMSKDEIKIDFDLQMHDTCGNLVRRKLYRLYFCEKKCCYLNALRIFSFFSNKNQSKNVSQNPQKFEQFLARFIFSTVKKMPA